MTKRKSISALITAFTSAILKVTLLQAVNVSEPHISGNGRLAPIGDGAAMHNSHPDKVKILISTDL
jgi:hypothetical protein